MAKLQLKCGNYFFPLMKPVSVLSVSCIGADSDIEYAIIV